MRNTNIKILVLDVDGTLTNGKIYIGDTGEIIKVFDVKDGYGLHNILPLYGINPVIITGRESQIVKNRCEELGIKYLYQGIDDKLKKLDELLKIFNFTYENVAYMGDDINDISCMKISAISACPHDAAKKVIELADYVSEKNGGNGAVRDFIEWLCEV